MKDKFLGFKMIDEKDIPGIPLYIDQVTSYIEEVFMDIKVDEDEKFLTKTMINNYVKAKVIDSPLKKKYNRKQIMELMMIYMLKNTTPIGIIDQVIKSEDTSLLFTKFKEQQVALMASLGDINVDDKMDVVLNLLISASIQKRYAEILLKEVISEAEIENEK